MINYDVTLKDGSEVTLEAASNVAAMQEAVERGLQPAFATAETVTVEALFTLTNTEELIERAKQVAQSWGTAPSNVPHVALGIVGGLLAVRNRDL